MTLNLLTIKQCAEILHLSPNRVRVLVRQGRIAAERVGNQYLIAPEALASLTRRTGRPRLPEEQLKPNSLLQRRYREEKNHEK